jgi:hypothetical protein
MIDDNSSTFLLKKLVELKKRFPKAPNAHGHHLKFPMLGQCENPAANVLCVALLFGDSFCCLSPECGLTLDEPLFFWLHTMSDEVLVKFIDGDIIVRTHFTRLNRIVVDEKQSRVITHPIMNQYRHFIKGIRLHQHLSFNLRPQLQLHLILKIRCNFVTKVLRKRWTFAANAKCSESAAKAQ